MIDTFRLPDEINKNLNGGNKHTQDMIEKYALDYGFLPGGAYKWVMAEICENKVLMFSKEYGALLYDAKSRACFELKENTLR